MVAFDPWQDGDVVLTTYGVGVIVGRQSSRVVLTSTTEVELIELVNSPSESDCARPSDEDHGSDKDWSNIGENPSNEESNDISSDLYIVRLWRIPGKSIASAAIATLHVSSVCI
jgi:hypothetical protein